MKYICKQNKMHTSLIFYTVSVIQFISNEIGI